MKKTFFVLLLLAWSLTARAFAPFTISDIRVDGLQRISVGTVFNYFPLKRGDLVEPQSLAQATRSLYSSGLFKDVVIERNGRVLVLRLLERPAINSLEFKGNKELKTDDLKQAFKQLGLAPGRVLNQAALDKAAQELERQYIAIGRYGTKVKPRTIPLERNRIAVIVNVYEGSTARVRHVRFIGNRTYSDKALAKLLDMKPSKWYKFFSKSDKFSNEKLKGDIETITSFYMDRGFVDFSMASSQVSISPDKKDITISYNISEGGRFYVRSQVLGAGSNVSQEFLRTTTKIRNGEVFSQKKLVDAREEISKKLGAHGYAFSEVTIVPQKVSPNRVDLVYTINPGKRTYVNRIHITGNTRTRDEVIRRELRLFEGGRFSGAELKRSTDRLRRLGYFDEVNVEATPVEGTDDRIDVNYSVVEKSTGSIKIGLGYSQSNGVGLTLGVSQDNFLGTGKRFAFNVSTNDANKVYTFSIRDPYFTKDGVSLGYGLFFRERDTEDLDVAAYLIDEFGGEIDFGIPINEYDRVSVGARLSSAEITCGSTFQECADYVNEHGANLTTAASGGIMGEFDLIDVFFNWSRDSRDRAIFPTSGSRQVLNLSFGVGDAKYNRLNYKNNNYFPLSDDVILHLAMDIGYGYSRGGSSKHLPFFKKFYAGGPGSVRGFEESTLSPATINDSDRFLGGNLKTVFNAELITPMPLLTDNKSVRLVTFVDAGYAFGLKDDFKVDDLRVSAGFGMKWLSPLGPLTFSIAEPIKSKDGDKKQSFQFQLGGTF